MDIALETAHETAEELLEARSKLEDVERKQKKASVMRASNL